MAVPNTTTFTLQNVVTEIDPTSDDLADCFSDANIYLFDPAYSSNVGLLKFRNYNGGFRTAFSGSVENRNVCGLALNQTYYWERSTFAPQIGDTIYSAATGSTNPSNGDYKFDPGPGNSNNIMKINSSGVFASQGAC